MSETTALLIISLLVAALQALTLFILSGITGKVEKVDTEQKQHLQDHAERKFCEPCREMLQRAISTP